MAISNRLALVLVLAFCITNAFADFVFQADGEQDDSRKNALHKKPLVTPEKCNENELFYPGDQNDDYVCDCNHGFIYHPKTDRCYEAYKQGPCPNNHYLMIRPNQYVPECLPNPCITDGYVSYKNNCYLLNSVEPCELPELSYHLSVNATSLELGCFLQGLTTRFTEEYGEGCYPGTKRSIQGKCEKLLF